MRNRRHCVAVGALRAATRSVMEPVTIVKRSTVKAVESRAAGKHAPLSMPSTAVFPETKKKVVLCLHGFRSNRELMQLSMQPILASEATGGCPEMQGGGTVRASLNFVFADAPHSAMGPPEPGIPSEVRTFEWWGTTRVAEMAGTGSGRGGDRSSDVAYGSGWQAFSEKQFRVSRDALLKQCFSSSSPPSWGPSDVVGIVGFSQGAAMALALAGIGDFSSLRWLACFSAVPPRTITAKSALPLRRLPILSFHCFDGSECHSDLCREVARSYFATNPQVVHHSAGHAIPSRRTAQRQGDALLHQEFWQFVGRAMRADR